MGKIKIKISEDERTIHTKRKPNTEVKNLISEEVAKNMALFKEDLIKDFKKILYETNKETKRNKEVEESIDLFLEHYISIKEYVKSEQRNINKEFIDEARDSIFQDLMEERVSSHEISNTFENIFKNFEKTKALYEFLTSIFNEYVKTNLDLKDKIRTNQNGKYQKNMRLYRNYRTAVLLKEHYMEGKSLDVINIYGSDVYCTSKSDYNKKFVVDKKVLIQNLAPRIFGIDGLELLREEE